MKIVTVTGRSDTITRPQAETLGKYIVYADIVRHGLCEGTDEAAHFIAIELGIPVYGHPGVDSGGNPKKRARCEGFEKLFDPEPFLVRNRTMVDGSTHVVAVLSRQSERYYRSGEWSTVKYAIRTSVPVTLVLPDGSTSFIEGIP